VRKATPLRSLAGRPKKSLGGTQWVLGGRPRKKAAYYVTADVLELSRARRAEAPALHPKAGRDKPFGARATLSVERRVCAVHTVHTPPWPVAPLAPTALTELCDRRPPVQ
jgi:hypothetical protein